MVVPSIKSKPEPRFKVGDKVTYVDTRLLQNKGYHFGGGNMFGDTGRVLEINRFFNEFNCYEICVSISNSEFGYTMLETEFQEYNMIKKYNAFNTMLINRRTFKDKNNGKTKWQSKASI